MLDINRSRLMMFVVVAVLALCGGGARTQDEVPPTNDLPNPYQTTTPWGKLPQGRTWGALSAVYIRNDMIYVADSESNGVAPHPGWKRGIRIGSLKDGKVLYRIPDPLEMKGTSSAEGLAVDVKGNVYGAEVGPRQLVKHVKQ